MSKKTEKTSKKPTVKSSDPGIAKRIGKQSEGISDTSPGLTIFEFEAVFRRTHPQLLAETMLEYMLPDTTGLMLVGRYQMDALSKASRQRAGAIVYFFPADELGEFAPEKLPEYLREIRFDWIGVDRLTGDADLERIRAWHAGK